MGYELSINGILLPSPDIVTIAEYDISEAKRNALGKMIIQYIREDLHKLECTWSILTTEEYEIIKKAIKKKAELSTSYFLPSAGGWTQISTYRGDRIFPICMFDGGKPVYKGFQCNLIEM